MANVVPIFVDHVGKKVLAGPPFDGSAVSRLDPWYQGDLQLIRVFFVDIYRDYQAAELRYFRRVTRYPGATMTARLGYFLNGNQTILNATNWSEFVPSMGAPTVARDQAGSASVQEIQHADFPSEPSGLCYLSGASVGQYIYFGDSLANMKSDSNGILTFSRISLTRLQWYWNAVGSHPLATITTPDYLPSWDAYINLGGPNAAATDNFLGLLRTRQAVLEIRFTPSAGDAEVVIQIAVEVRQSLLA